MIMKEDFDRCRECSNPYFVPVTTVLIRKGSEERSPVPYSQGTQYKCSKCGFIQYSTDHH